MASGWRHEPGYIGNWSFGGVCSTCRAPATCTVLTRHSERGLYWTRACDACAPAVASMAAMNEVINGN